MREYIWEVKPNPGISWVWRSMLNGRDLLKSNGRWNIGSGENIQISEDYWLASSERLWLDKGVLLLKYKSSLILDLTLGTLIL